MAGRTDDAVIRLVFQTLGADAAAKMAEALRDTAAAGASAQAAVDAMGESATDSANSARQGAEGMGKAARDAGRSAAEGLDATAKAAGQAGAKFDDVGERAEDASEKASRGFGRIGIEAGRFAQDAAAGWEMGGLSGVIRATSNNVEGLLLSLGMGGGLLGVLALLAGVAPLVMGRFKDLFSEDIPKAFRDEVERLSDRLKELEEKPVRLAADYSEIEAASERISELRSAKEALDRLMKTASDDEKASGDAVAKELSRPENRVFEENLRKRVPRDPRLFDLNAQVDQQTLQLEKQRQFVDSIGGVSDPVLRAGLAKAEQTLRETTSRRDKVLEESRKKWEETIDVTVNRATKGVGAEQEDAQEQLADWFRQLGGKETETVARQIEYANPRLVRFRRETEERIQKENAALNAQGKANEAAAMEELRRAKAEEAEEERAYELEAAKPERTGKQAAANLRRKQQEREREEASRARQTESDVSQSASFFASPSLTAEMGAALAANEARQASGGRGARSDEAMRAAMESEVARRLAGQPGAEGQEQAIAAEMVNRVIEQYNHQLFDMMQRTQNQQGATISLYQQLSGELMRLQMGTQAQAQQLQGAATRRRSGLGRF